MANRNWTNDWRVWASVLAAAAVLATSYVLYSNRDPALVVQVARPTRTVLRDYISCNGKVEPVSPYLYRAQFATFVTGVFAEEGGAVRRGETVLTLDAKEIQVELQQAKVQLLAAQNDLRNDRAGGPPDERAQLVGDLRRAEADVKRLQDRQQLLEKLVQSQAATREEMSENATALTRAQALLDTLQERQKDLADRSALQEDQNTLRVKQAEEQVQLLETKLQSATVTSAIDGMLYNFPLRQGDYVRPGDALAEIADLRKVQVRAFVDEADLGGLKLNQAVTITWDTMPDRAWTGKTEQIPKEVSARGSRSVGEALCSIDNSKLELLPNVNVDVRILVAEKENVLVIPRGAVRTEQQSHFVFVVEGDRLHRRQVSLGIANSTSYEVVSGLDESDHVAVSSNLDLRDGSVVSPLNVN
jgi:HlyD family secretion protein